MKLQIHSIHFDADQKLLEFIQRRADKLETFFDRIIDGEAFLRVEKNGLNENKLIEVKINIPGNQLFTKSHDKSFEAAADKAMDVLKRQLKKHKEKLVAH